jgi:YfiH family protein
MNFYQAPNLIEGKHAFFGRTGGVSQGIYSSLNFNYKSQDDLRNLAKNMQIVGNFYHRPAQNIARLLQAHTNEVIFIDRPSQFEVRADGVVTNSPYLVLGITTADCIPILFADYRRGIIGAAHAGWRGVLYGVIENTIEVMLKYGARINNISAAAGPCLQKGSFEVKNDMRSQFINMNKELGDFFDPRDDHDEAYLCDLEGIISYKLERMGIYDVTLSGIDTYTNPKSFFSYRRNMHQGLIQVKGDFPIQLSTICL